MFGSRWITVGAILCGFAVASGAFGAHWLDKIFAEKYAGKTRVVAGATVPLAAKFLHDFKTGTEYQMYHGLGLIAVGVLVDRRKSRLANLAGWSFSAGILLFSGSLYLLTLTGVTKWGAVTPLGGAAFLLGWGLLAGAAASHPRDSTAPQA